METTKMDITMLPASGAKTSIALLLQTALSELGRNNSSAKTALETASSLLKGAEERRDEAGQTIGDFDPSARGGLAPWQIARVKAFVEANIAEPLRVNMLSEVARLSAGHFSRAFRRSVGEAPHAYIVRRRIARARSLMLTSNASLSDVALACGFADQAHLCKKFRRATDTSPAAWRRAHSPREANLTHGRDRDRYERRTGATK